MPVIRARNPECCYQHLWHFGELSCDDGLTEQISGGSEAIADAVELVADLVGEALHGHNRGHRDQSSDERVLDKVLPGFIDQQALSQSRNVAGFHG
jgi:hypothetical protein